MTRVTQSSSVAGDSPLSGREKLLAAALRLAARRSSVASLGLRELAREAGLNPNTFYRHFNNLEELSAAIVEDFGSEIRLRRNLARQQSQDFPSFLAQSVTSYFEFAAEHPEAFIVGFRELSLGSDTSRAVKRLMDELAEELVGIAAQFGALSGQDKARELEIAGFIVNGLFMLALEYIEQKPRRRAIAKKAERYVALLLYGAAAMNAGP